MASASWNESSFKWKDISVPESVEIDVVCAKEDMFQVCLCLHPQFLFTQQT